MATWREAKEQATGHFFDEDTMKYFGGRLNGLPKEGEDGSYYGVVSSKPPHGPRFYDVVRIQPNGETTRAHPAEDPFGGDRIHKFSNREKALRHSEALAEGSEDPDNYEWF